MNATIDTGSGGRITLVAVNEDVVRLRTSVGRNGTSVKLSGEHIDSLIRALITARGGEWLDVLANYNAREAGK